MSQTAALKLIKADAATDPLPDMPIDQAQITAGNPVARGAVLTQSADKKVTSGLWTCEPGEFDFQFAWDEFVHILEGEVTLTEEGGDIITLRPGDAAHFPFGVKCHWKVTKAVRKFFVLRTPEPFIL
jgi:uncharacterized cupin superfamily protein